MEECHIKTHIKTINRDAVKNKCQACDFKHDCGEVINTSGDNFMLVKSEDGISITTNEKHFYTLKIKHCPICGRKL